MEGTWCAYATMREASSGTFSTHNRPNTTQHSTHQTKQNKQHNKQTGCNNSRRYTVCKWLCMCQWCVCAICVCMQCVLLYALYPCACERMRVRVLCVLCVCFVCVCICVPYVLNSVVHRVWFGSLLLRSKYRDVYFPTHMYTYVGRYAYTAQHSTTPPTAAGCVMRIEACSYLCPCPCCASLLLWYVSFVCVMNDFP